MLYLIFFLVCFLASVIGAICGIGGGTIIKPVLDAFGVMDAAQISFLSGCTVLSMSTYSVLKNKVKGESHVQKSTGFPLAMGAAVGGVVGKLLFSYVKSVSPDINKVGQIQAFCLLIVTLGTLVYTLFKSKVKTLNIEKAAFCLLIGLILGLLSAFLGIGGGPINLVVLFFFFSMSTKTAAENSLYIIFFSQLASLGLSMISGEAFRAELPVLLLMIVGGIGGGIVGRALNKRLKESTVDKLFIGLMVVIIGVNIYNIFRFS